MNIESTIIGELVKTMATVNTLYDTPVRHGEDSITKTSLLSRINRIKNKSVVEKISRSDEEKTDTKMAVISFSSEIIKPASLDEQSTDAGFHSKSGNDLSVITVDEMDATTPTTCEELFSKCDVEEAIMISKQLHSTPRDFKVQTKAVSSTPNQEILDSSRLRRSVASQTTFTLNARVFNEFDEDIKSYIIEIPEERSQPVIDLSQTPHFNAGFISPLRNACTSKLTNFNTPIEDKMTNVRKLSLRSKTMISSAIEKSKDMLPKYTSLVEKQLISNTFSLFPHPKTTPPCSEKVFHNPFEVDLPERLGKSIFSPNVFENVLSPSEDSEYLRWTIEDISSINPAAIEEDFTSPSDDEDPERESQVQQEIERYFSETHLVLSPDDLYQSMSASQYKKVRHHMRAAASTPQKVQIVNSKESKNANTQTALTLPEMLPNELEVSLRSLFKFFETDELNLSASNLRRKLFFHSEDEPPSPVRFEVNSSPITKDSWEIDNSPYAGAIKGRYLTPLANQEAFSSPEMSPVVLESPNVQLKSNLLSSTRKRTLHHYFSGNLPQAEEEKNDLFVAPVKNVHCTDGLSEMAVDSDSNSAVSSALPSSHDTEDSWQHCHPFSMMASTPTRRAD